MSSSVIRNASNKRKYRTRTELFNAILQSAANNENRIAVTRLMYQVNTSYIDLTNYISDLLKAGLLEYNEETRMYSTTEKGDRFMQLYARLREELNVLKWLLLLIIKKTVGNWHIKTDTPITSEEAEAFIKLAIQDLGEGSDVQLFQMGELLND
jgi:predicted transcriptional regulator